MLVVVVVLACVFLFIVVNIAMGLLLAFYNRKCPYCGKRTKYQYKRTNESGSVEEFVFHCPHCGAFENVKPSELMGESDD